jgi:hypothetical protein
MQNAEAAGRPAKEDVLSHAKLLYKRKLLENDGYPCLHRMMNVTKMLQLASDSDLAIVLRINATENLY